jgi:hypothetical protein
MPLEKDYVIYMCVGTLLKLSLTGSDGANANKKPEVLKGNLGLFAAGRRLNWDDRAA